MSAPSNETTLYFLEMCHPEEFRPKEAPAGLEIVPIVPADAKQNLQLYRDVGAPWKWTDRLKWSEQEWNDFVDRETLTTWLGQLNGQTVGYFELDSAEPETVELAYFGLLPDFIGRGLGGVLLSAALRIAWQIEGTKRVWVYTCSNDHKHALANYRKRGFKLFKTEIE